MSGSFDKAGKGEVNLRWLLGRDTDRGTHGEWEKCPNKDYRGPKADPVNMQQFLCNERGDKVRTRILCMEQPSCPSWLSAVCLLIAGIWRHWKPPALLLEWISESLTSVEVMFLKLFRKCQKSLWLLFIGYSKERLYLERNWNKLPPNLLNHSCLLKSRMFSV